MRRAPSLKFPFSVQPILWAGGAGSTSAIRACSSTTATLWSRRSTAGRNESSRWRTSKSKPTTREKSNPSNAVMMNGLPIMKCHPSRSCRFGSPDYRGSIPRTAAAPRWKLKWMGRAGNSTRQANLQRWDLRDLSSRQTPTRPWHRDESASVQQSKGRSYTSYGSILFKASATTLFGRIHVDKQNSFISEKCDFAGLWELARITKLPIQYSARTTTGTGISYMQMELAHRDGV